MVPHVQIFNQLHQQRDALLLVRAGHVERCSAGRVHKRVVRAMLEERLHAARITIASGDVQGCVFVWIGVVDDDSVHLVLARLLEDDLGTFCVPVCDGCLQRRLAELGVWIVFGSSLQAQLDDVGSTLATSDH